MRALLYVPNDAVALARGPGLPLPSPSASGPVLAMAAAEAHRLPDRLPVRAVRVIAGGDAGRRAALYSRWVSLPPGRPVGDRRLNLQARTIRADADALVLELTPLKGVLLPDGAWQRFLDELGRAAETGASIADPLDALAAPSSPAGPGCPWSGGSRTL